MQSFPDWFRFPVARTHQFRLIGNAVPPLVAEAVGCELRDFLTRPHSPPERIQRTNALHNHVLAEPRVVIPLSRMEAARELERLAQLDRRALRELSADAFTSGWRALLFLFPGLHPDSALDHGATKETVSVNQLALPGFDELLSRRYVRSGWPVALELIGLEAWRRYESQDIGLEDFYCVEAQHAGMQSLPHTEARP